MLYSVTTSRATIIVTKSLSSIYLLKTQLITVSFTLSISIYGIYLSRLSSNSYVISLSLVVCFQTIFFMTKYPLGKWLLQMSLYINKIYDVYLSNFTLYTSELQLTEFVDIVNNYDSSFSLANTTYSSGK